MYDSLLVAIDGSSPADTAAEHALDLAERFDATVSFVSALETHPMLDEVRTGERSTPPDRASLDERTRAALDRFEAAAEDAGVFGRTIIEVGAAHEVIDEAADVVDADVVLVGTHGRTGVDRLLLGSVAARVLRTSDVPVLTTPVVENPGAVDAILLPTDGDEGGERATENALALADRYDAVVHAISIVDPRSLAAGYDAGPALPELMETLTERHQAAVDDVTERAGSDVEVVTAVPEGTPAATIQDYIADHDIDLVVMGTHGRSGLDRYLLGSVAERTVRQSPVPVLATPPTAATDGDES